MCVASTAPQGPQQPGLRTGLNPNAPLTTGPPAPPLPPPATALDVAPAAGLRRTGSDLEDQRRPLNPLGLPRSNRLGL